MTPRLANEDAREVPESAPRLWGLTATQLHDAFWRSRGVECVRRADGTLPTSKADAYLLLEPDQLVVFDLREISEALQWTRATLCRLRVIEAGEDAYRERVRIGDDGLVKRIERVYTREYRAGYRVLLTDRFGLAKAWHSAESRRDAWLALRRAVPWFRTDDFRVHGHSYRRNDSDAEAPVFTSQQGCFQIDVAHIVTFIGYCDVRFPWDAVSVTRGSAPTIRI